MKNDLEIRDLRASVDGKEILHGLNLRVPQGEVHAVMGPNGSGKSTLANTIMGNPVYKVTSGDIIFAGESIMERSTDERARLGLFLSFQYPVSLPGVSLRQLIKKSSLMINGADAHLSLKSLSSALDEARLAAGLPEDMIERSVNEGFSGGEKKKSEILQIEMLKPGFVIFDEIDSGLDIDALKSVADSINRMKDGRRSFLIITHYQRILSLIGPDVVHVMKDGEVIRSGDASLVEELEREGYLDMEAA